MNKRTTIGLLGLAALGAYAFRRELLAKALRLTPPQYAVSVARDIRMKMPDGVTLLADHYFPKAHGSFPTILIRSGYGRELEAGWFGRIFALLIRRFAERGYHVILQTTRGRFGSEGDFRPLMGAREDGLATLDWIAHQPWFNGAVGMWGPSWLGYMQWAVAADAPPYLKAIVPSITASQLYSFTYPDGAFGLDMGLRWVTSISEDGVPGKKPIKRSVKELRRVLNSAFMHLPLIETDEIVVGEPVPFYREWFDHPQRDESYWTTSDRSGEMARVEAATHLVSGWYDFFLRELLDDYTSLAAAGHTPYLTIGPWSHTQPEVALEALRQGIIWFDAQLKGDGTRLRQKPVRIYVMGPSAGFIPAPPEAGAQGARQGHGRSHWRELESWPPHTHEMRYYLREQSKLSSEPPLAISPSDRYRYDPADPTPAVGGPQFGSAGAGAKDNRALEARADVLCYTTPMLVNDIEIVGTPRVRLYVRSSLAHTDFFARLCDVYPDGRSINVSDGLLRIEPGIGAPQPDGSLRIEIALWPTAYGFRRGHRIRLQVSSGAHPRWSRNLGTGEPLGTATRMCVADQTLQHDDVHPSHVILPTID